MTYLRVTNPFDIFEVGLQKLLKGRFQNPTSDSVDVVGKQTDGHGYLVALYGQGLEFDSNNIPKDGTIRSIYFLDIDYEADKATPLAHILVFIDAADLREALLNGDLNKFLKDLFQAEDVISGSDGSDALFGLAGDDQFYSSKGADAFNGGAGVDTVVYALDGRKGVTINLADPDRGSGEAKGDTFKNIESIFAPGSDDRIVASNTGGIRLNGGFGSDTLIGGDGRDGFVFADNPYGEHIDVVKNFDPENDTIYIGTHFFEALFGLGSRLPKEFFTTSEATSVDHHIIYDKRTGSLFYDGDGDSSSVAVKIADFADGTALSHIDIRLI